MRIRHTFFIGFSLVIWIFINYLAVRVNRQISITDTNEEVDNRLKKFEDGIAEEFKLNKYVINNPHTYTEAKKHDEIIENEIKVPTKTEFKGTIIPVLVLACNRVSVSRCLDQLIQYRPHSDQFPIIVSQDCNHQEITDVINRYGSQVLLIQQPDQSDIAIWPKMEHLKGYFKIARHYCWALNQTFFKFNFETVIIVEDDLDVAPDFFEYFLGTYPLLLKDPFLWCISAWNDNGKLGLVNEKKPELLYRTDFFPGLGWMLTKTLWIELCNKWPRTFWDDWIRQPEQRKNRACIRPEISRTRTFGEIGVSNGLFFERHLKFIKLNEAFVPFTKINLSYLMKDIYDSEFIRTVYQSAIVSYEELKDDKVVYDGAVRIIYRTKGKYKRAAKLLGLMDDFRSGVPRTGYRGIVTFHYKGRTVYLAPSMNWKGYDLSWS